MKKIIYTLVFTMFSLFVGAQNQYLSSADSDPQATKILDAMKNKFESFDAVKIAFNLDIISPMGSDSQDAMLYQKDNKYVLINKYQTVHNDGETVWMHAIDDNEVQVTDAEDGEALLTPDVIINMYEEGNMVYAVTGSQLINGLSYTKIDFKPLDNVSEYRSVSILVGSDNMLYSLNILGTDGNRYVLKVAEVDESIEIDDDYFTFDTSKFPGIYIEDLRL